MEFTCELSKLYAITPFEILRQDKDNVIMLVNYYIAKGQDNPTEVAKNDLTEKQGDKSFWALL